MSYLFDKDIWYKWRKHVIGFWLLVILALLSIVFVFYGTSKGMLGELPTFEELENPDLSLATEVYSSDSVLLGKYYRQNRSPILFEDLSPNVVNALVATEDVRYYNHSGIDFRGLARAVFGVLTLDMRGGASTISQQLAKLLFHGVSTQTLVERIIQKIKEQVIAVRLESRYTKEEIMQMYLNTAEWSDNAWGIKSASKTYFNKLPSELNVEEAAVLVGMLQAPTRFNPRLHPTRSINRRNIVLSQMNRYGYLDKETYELLRDTVNCPIKLDFKKNDHNEGIAPYFREFLRQRLQEWANNPENFKPDGSKYDIYKDGLQVHTTLNAKMQGYAEEAVNVHMTSLQEQFFDHWKSRDPWKDFPDELNRLIVQSSVYKQYKEEGFEKKEILKMMKEPHQMEVFSYQGPKDTVMSSIDSLRYHRMFLQSGFIVVEPQTGFIKAWVGGTDYENFKYDHITSRRQIGSTFKPFVYATAIDNGYSPCFQITDVPVTFEDFDNWTPENSDGKYTGLKFTLKQCLEESKNTCSAYLIKQVGAAEVIKLARRLGITSHIDPYPSICLGTPDISAMEMAGSYTAFANKGLYTQPIYFTSITDKNGNEIYSNVPISTEAMSEEKAYIMVEMLRSVVNRGTGTRIRFTYKLQADIGGKTGTTQNQSDGWFMGITPELVGAVWTGGEDRFIRFRSIKYGQGAHMALPIWGEFFKRLYADKELGYTQDTKFEAPEGKLSVEMDCSKYETEDDTDNTTPTFDQEFDR